MTLLTNGLNPRLRVGGGSRWADAARIGETILRLLMTWMERRRSRRGLAELDERMLRDLGLSRWEVAREMEKPFWRA